MRSIQATGKSVDAAIFSGLTELGLSIDEVSIDIVQRETKGLLGIGAKPAIVVLTEKPQEEIVIPDFSKERERERRDRRENRRDRRESRGERRNGREERSGDKPAREDRVPSEHPADGSDAAEKPAENAERKPRGDRNRSRAPRPVEDAAASEQPAESEEPIVYTEEAAANEPAAKFVSGLLEKMHIEGKVLAANEEDAVRLRIDCSEMGVLIGHRGETLDAVQYLTSLVINRNRKTDGYTRVTINTEDYREKREETLVRLAKRIAQQVKATGTPKALEPMNPYERRIIHSALQKHPYVTTQSEGEEPNRRVVISPKRRAGRQYRYHA